MNGFVWIKQICDFARVRVRGPGPAYHGVADHCRPYDWIAVRSVADVTEHVWQRADTIGHCRSRRRKVLGRGSDLPQRPSRVAYRPRLRQYQTVRAEACRSTRDSGLRDANKNLEAPASLRHQLLQGRNDLEGNHAQVRTVRSDSALAAAFPALDSQPHAMRRAAGGHLVPDRMPHRAPRQRSASSHVNKLSTRPSRCDRAPAAPIHLRCHIDASLLRAAHSF